MKDLAKIPINTRARIEKLVFETVPTDSNEAIYKRISKMKGYEGYYKIRSGDYRIGLLIREDILEFQRILDRKDIYRFFP